MADATSEAAVTLEFHGALADKFAPLGHRRGARTRVEVGVPSGGSVADLLTRLATTDERYAQLYEIPAERLAEHVEVVLNDRVLDLQGGVKAVLKSGDVLTFIDRKQHTAD